MVARLRELDAILSDSVADAFAGVPRHLFTPGASVADAYAPNSSVLSVRNHRGVLTSTVSAAHIQAVMLEQADLQPGMRVLEIGSGGYNAALMAEIVGSEGRVTTVDIDPGVIARARSCLDAAGYRPVRTVMADAENGVPDGAPYDRIVVTVRAWDIPPAWIAQLTGDGRLVVPLRLRGLTRSVALDRVNDRGAVVLSGSDVQLCSFVPMQGAGAHSERVVPLLDGRAQLHIDGHADSVDADRLGSAIRGARIQRWSGVEFDRPDLLALWLATRLPRFGILSADQSVVDDGLLTAATRQGAPAAFTPDSLAYRTKRAVPGTEGFETGVLAWGPAADRLTEEHLATIRDRDHRRPHIDVAPATGPDTGLPEGAFVLDRSHTRIAVSWT
jgi:protein-L-isoaspartate(D-aspartate) O-methyltransferase